MINPIELRIGNTLKDAQGRICKVTEINELEFKAWPINNGPITTLPHMPLMLSENILTDNLGYKKLREFEFYKEEDPNFILCNKFTHFEVILFRTQVCVRFVKVIFIHELQNLAFDVQKQELKFKI